MARKINCILVFYKISRPNKVDGQGYTSLFKGILSQFSRRRLQQVGDEGLRYQVGVIRAKERKLIGAQ
jgi:hypothetical protein